MKCALKSLAYNMYVYKPLVWMRKKKITVLMYHGFYQRDKIDGLESFGSRWCSTSEYEKQIHHLRSNYNVISMDQLVATLNGDQPLPDNPVLITMDDGYESNFTLAYPILKKYQVPFTVFTTTDFVGKGQLLWADRIDTAIRFIENPHLNICFPDGPEIAFDLSDLSARSLAAQTIRTKLQILDQSHREIVISALEAQLPKETELPPLCRPLNEEQLTEMSKGGLLTIGSHTVTHPNLTLCSENELQFELSESKKIIEETFHTECHSICYPGSAYNQLVTKASEKAGYTCGFVIEERSNSLDTMNPFTIQRLGISRDLSLPEFALRLCTR